MGAKIQAVTFDWFGTLATHREKKGRGARFREYLAQHGLQSAPWDRRCLYEAFDYYADTYRPELSADEKLRVWRRFTEILFGLLQVKGETANRPDFHAPAIRDNFGPACFQLFDDVEPPLNALKQNGLRLGVISNWHRGLDSFCAEMNLSGLIDVVVASSDVGVEKPDSRIFAETVRRLGVRPEEAIHVGDLVEDDLNGAVAAGLGAVLIDRSNRHPEVPNRILSLVEINALLDRLR
jgi:FMN phosphatase YigB (HAD superfamily)